MKRKKTVPSPAVPMTEPPVMEAVKDSLIQRIFPFAFPVILFCAMTLQTVPMALGLAALTFLLTIGREPIARFVSRLSVPVWGFLIFLVLNLAGSLYTDFGQYAYGEFFKILASGSLGILLLARGRKADVRVLLYGFLTVSALIALLCIDQAVDGTLFRNFAAVMGALGDGNYLELDTTMESWRANGIYNDANISGSLFALALLVGISLIHTGESRKGRFFASFLMGISAVGLVTGVSRGSMLIFGVACVGYLIFVGKGNRFPLFSILLAAGICTVAFGGVSLVLLTRGSELGTWAALPCGVAIWLLAEFPGRAVADVLQRHMRVMCGVLVVLVVLLAGAAVAALTVTEPFTAGKDPTLYRAVAVTPGETYSFTGDWDQDSEIRVSVYGYTREQVLTGEGEQYAWGLLEDVEFTVPEDVTNVFVSVGGTERGEVRQLSLSDGTEIPLKYKFLPENIVRRLQGSLFENRSFLLRVQYVKDGWTLFTQAPLFGHGLGATEGLLTSVQPFFYESLYLHNHILQVMVETGLIGAAAFLIFLLGTAWILVSSLRKKSSPMAAGLAACWVMMNLHGLMELTFSICAFQCVAFLLLMLGIFTGETEGEALRTSPGKKWVCIGVAWLWVLISGGLMMSTMIAQRQLTALETSGLTREAYISKLERLEKMDAYCDQVIKVDLMVNALQEGGTINRGTAARYARELRETGDFDACYYVAAYYYLPLRDLPEFFACMGEGLAQERSNSDAWISAFNLYRQAFGQLDESLITEFVSGVTQTGQLMDQANEILLVDVTLDEAGQTLLNTCRSIEDQQMDAPAAYAALTLLLSGAETGAS